MNYKNKIITLVMAIFLAVLSFWSWCKERDTYSESERRVLADFPKMSRESIVSGKFVKEFEAYAVDQFPMREEFRSVKAASELYLLQKQDYNGLYVYDGYVAKQEYPLREKMLAHAAEHFQEVYEQYMKNTEVRTYFSIIPDKNYFLAEKSGQLTLNYNQLMDYMKKETEYMSYIDITELLSIEDYYKTDTHWRQERIGDVAHRLAEEMGVELIKNYEIDVLEQPFYGVYAGQLSLPVAPDELAFCTNEVLENCKVTSYSTGIPIEQSIYDMEAAYGKDAYEMFLSGTEALLVIENPMADTDKELIIFRDSFGSSLAPLLVEGYRKITLIDTRYIHSSLLGEWVEFSDQDVLFLYSTLMLNNSLAMK